MRSVRAVAVALVLVATVLAGCTNGAPPSSTENDTPTPGTGEGGNATAVTITHVPARAAPEADALVCWRVDGTGTVPHTAVHYDTQPHPSPRSFQDYAGGLRYPGNSTRQSREGYALPGEFCTTVPMPPQGPLYFRAHVMDAAGPPGVLSDERAIRPVGEALGVVLTSLPTRQSPGTDALVCWRVTGSGNVPHTAVHYDTQSRPDAQTFTAYAGGAAYPANETAQRAGGYDLPGGFCTGIPMPETGEDVWLRAHVIDAAGPPGRLSDEHRVRAAGTASSVNVTYHPSNAPPGSLALVCWQAEGNGNVARTGIHYDVESHPDAQSAEDYRVGARYPNNNTVAAPAGYDLPGSFCTGVPMPLAGTVFLRAHVVDASGPPGKMSAEARINVG